MAASEYITLKEAAASTPYSQEYLSLRARQGRLKAIKKNDVWYTTRAWLEEYWRGVSGGDTGPIAGSEASRSLVPYQSLAPARSIRSLVRAAGRSPVVHGVLVGILFVSGALAAPESWSRAAGDAAGMFFENVGRGTAVVLTAIPGTSRYGLAAAVAETIEGQAQQARTFFREIGEGFAVLLGRGRNALGRVLLGRRVFQEPEFTRGVFGPERKDVRQEQKGIVQVGEALAVTPAVPAPSVIVREVTTTIREVPAADSSLLAGLTATREELARTQQNFVLLRSGLNQDVAFLKNEIEALKAQAALPLSVSPALQQVIYQTVVQTATPPGASLGSKEITAALESGAIAPTSMRVGSMTLNGVTLAGLATIDSSPAITGILTISGTGTSTVASSLQVASYLTAGNLLTVPYFTATSTTATSTIATGGFTVGASQFVVQQASGNVGIGTTSPGSLLGLQGIGNFGETRSTLYSALTLPSLAATSTTATSTFAGRTVFTSVPTLAHAFSSWAIGVSGGNALDAPLIVNPSSAAADTNLIGVAVNDAVRFLVDAEGDVFVNSLTSVGAQTLSSTTASTLFVENNTTLGDGITDLFTINGGTVIYNNVATTTLVNSRVNAFAIGTSTTEVPLLTFDTLNSRLGLLTVAPTNRFDVGGGQFVVSAGGNVGLGTTSPGSLLALQGIANFAPANSFLFSPLTLPSFTATSTTATSTIAGGLTTAGLASSNGLTLTGGSLLQTNTATSSFAGGLSLTHLAASNGLTLTGGILRSTVAATSTLDGGLAITAGALRLSTLTAGSVLFAGASGALQENNANLFWDNTNGRLGIGTTSPSALFSVAATSGNSAYFAGNVGIGTNAPARPLNIWSGVADTIQINRTGTLVNGDTVGLISFLDDDGVSFNTQLRALVEDATNGYSAMVLRTRGADGVGERIRITSTGNVGIGTTSPGGILHLVTDSQVGFFFDRYANAPPNIIFRRANGTIAAPSAVTLDNQLFALGGRGYGSTGFSSGGRAAIFGAASETWTDTAQGAYLAFNTTQIETATAVERMRISDAGNIGIGTTSPSDVLEVWGSGSAGTFVRNMSADNTTARDVLVVGRMYSAGAGAAGIGAKISFDPENAASNRVSAGKIGGVLTTATAGSEEGALIFETTSAGSAGTERMRILGNGNVGIGTTEPSSTLAIDKSNSGGDQTIFLRNTADAASSRARMALYVGGSSAGDSQIDFVVTGGTTWAMGLDNSDSDKFKIGTDLVLGTNTALTIDTAGNVGIGTTNPTERILVLSDGTTETGIKLTNTSTGGTSFYLNSTGAGSGISAGKFSISDATDHRLVISSGNVGIGTTAPSSKLYITSAVDSAGLIIEDVQSVVSNNITLQLLTTVNSGAGAANLSQALSFAAESTTNGTNQEIARITAVETTATAGAQTGDLQFNVWNGGSFTTPVIVKGSGNVGIGTTGPEQQLHLHKTGATPILKMYSNRSADSAVMENRILFGGTTNTGWGTPDGAGIDFRVNSPTESTSGQLRLWAYPQTTSSPTMSLVGGNVGIGTTNPSAGVLTVLPTAESISDVITIPDYNVGNGNAGPIIRVGRNNNGTATGAGSVNFVQKDATDGYVWQDDAGNMRINTLAPTNGNDTAGTVIGTQTSWIELKTNISSWSGEGALQTVLDTPLYNFEFINDGFKTAQNGKPSYSGLVIGESDRAQNAWYARNLGTNQTPVLNEPNLFGYLTASVQEIGRRISLTAAPTSTPTLTINSGGLVGIASTSPWRTLSVTGTVGFSSSLTAESGSDNYLCIDPATYEVTDGGANCGASSLRYKKDIASLDYGLDAVLKLNPVSFYWNEAAGRPHDLTRHLGFIAEEVYGVIPEVVALNASSTPESIEYDKLTAILTKAIQELNAKIEAGIAILKDLIVDTLTAEMVITNKIRAEDIETQRLKVESGVTVKDRGTGEPYCMFIEYGAVRSAPGPCSTTSAASSGSATPSGSEEPATPQDQQTVDTPTTSEPDEDAPPESTPEPSESPTPDPEPSASPAPSPTEPSEQPTDP